ncbi:hypothetical protein [Aurantiacibacter sp. D1-12]|uniref:hypothetical protein n=1 Tax=Aurantiacibacter sp. D1-12 TaxID=2993658 RepID=UPI00237C81CF|nr:hypothetical protein [Aurantiacibacter sp. D1-12]MDE1467344.1 hypothetical protein [Aurantiacibacter sp. D1-12]
MRYTITTLALAVSSPAFAQEVSLPQSVEWGASAEAVEGALEGKCADGLTVREISPPFLPNASEQVQIDCAGLDHFGAPRFAEFVIGDDRLQMVWVMVEPEEEDSAIAAMREAYGQPSAESELFIAFESHRTAWRHEPAEFLYYSPELSEAMSAWFASAAG